MNTIKIGSRILHVEFDDDTASVGKQITEMLTHTRVELIDSVMRNLPTYVRSQHKAALTSGQLRRLWKTLTDLRVQNITNAVYKKTVAAARAKSFMCLSTEAFSSEIDRAIALALNTPQLPLPLEAVEEVAAPIAFYSDEDYQTIAVADSQDNAAQLALPLVETM